MRDETPDTTLLHLQANLASLRTRIHAASARGPHAAADVRLVVVTKSVGPELFAPLQAAGVEEIAESRVQSASVRRAAAPAGLTWHGIGHLQRNKAAEALRIFDVLHAVDSQRLARRLDELLGAHPHPTEPGEAAQPYPIYLQVNAAEDPAKHGVPPTEALELLRAVQGLPHLRPLGFMTMGKSGIEDADLRSTFRTLREIRDEALRLGLGREPPAGLSMGMSGDFEIAIEEGATLIRVGRAVFDGVDSPGTPTARSAGESPRTTGEPR